MFGNEEGIDYAKLKENRRQDREDTRYLEQCFKLNIGNDLDKMLAAVTGNYHTPQLPGESDKITKALPGARVRPVVSSAGSYREATDDGRVSYGSPVGRNVTASMYQQAKYAEVEDVLDRFTFSTDDERRKNQMQIVTAAIRAVLPELIVKEVAANTKRAFKKYAEQFLKISGGIQVVFNFGGSKLKVSARGAFYGDETICVQKQDDDSIAAMVIRMKDESSHDDISDQFDIKLEQE